MIAFFDLLFLLGVEVQQRVTFRRCGREPGLGLLQLALEQVNVVFAFAQDVGGARQIEQTVDRRDRLGGADGEKEMRLFRSLIDSIHACVDGRGVRRDKGNRAAPVLQNRMVRHVRKHPAESLAEFVEFKFVNVERIGPTVGARFGVIAPVRRRDEEHAVIAQHSTGFVEQRIPIAQMFDDFQVPSPGSKER